MCLTPVAAAMPSARRPALELPIFIATPIGGGGSSTSPRKLVRWWARSSRLRHAGHDVDEAEQRRLELRVRGGEVHRLVVDRLQRVARGGQRGGEPPADLEELALERASSAWRRSLRRRYPARPWIASRGCSAWSLRCTRSRTPSTRSPSGSPPRWADITYELILVNDGSKDGTRDAMARRRGARPAREGRLARAQLRPPAGADRRARARPRRRDRDARRRPAGPAGGHPGDARALARGRRRRLRGARAAAGGDAVQARDRARLLPRLPPPHGARPRRRVRRLPADGPARAGRAAGDARAQPLPARDDGLDRLHADRGAVRAPGAPRGRDQVPAAQDAALLASTRSRRSRAAPLQWAMFLGFFFSVVAFLGDPADRRRPLRGHLRARRADDDHRSSCCSAGSS